MLSSKPVCPVPRRNLYFTDRDFLLWNLHERLINSTAVLISARWAISGLGGIGKTQAAIEYVHRYKDDYEAVFWIKADSQASLNSDFRDIAVHLGLLKEDDKRDPQLVVGEVKGWLAAQPKKWLLIFDNADDLEMVEDFLPDTGRGHSILLTTRANAVENFGAKPVEIDVWDEDEGSQFLLRRTERLSTGDSKAVIDDWNCAREIVREMGGLPLALEQAGAYIVGTRCSISDYLKLYREHRSDLLKRHPKKRLSSDNRDTVATTWSMSFQEVKEKNPAAIELLHLCAFLDPDAIPEEMITRGTRVLGPVLGSASLDQFRMNEMVEELLRFSLIRRNSRTLSIHRLVQLVIQNDMDEETRCLWAERAIRMIHHAFPDNVNDVKTWPQCQRCLPHALICKDLINRYDLASPEAARLLNQVGFYLLELAHFEDAEPFLRQALAIRERVLGADHPETAESFSNLAKLFFDQYKYPQAEYFYQQALNVRRRVLENVYHETSLELNRLALTYRFEKKYEEAEPLFKEALEIREQKLKLEDEDRGTLHCLNNLGLLYRDQSRYEEAERLFKRVLNAREKLASSEKEPGTVYLELAQSLQNLAVLYYEKKDQGRYGEAERLLKRALKIREQLLPPEHPQIARVLHYIGSLYEAQGKDEEAEKCFKRALAIREKVLRADNPLTIETKEKYAALLRRMKRDEEAAILEAQIKAIQDLKLSKD